MGGVYLFNSDIISSLFIIIAIMRPDYSFTTSNLEQHGGTGKTDDRYHGGGGRACTGSLPIENRCTSLVQINVQIEFGRGSIFILQVPVGTEGTTK
mmetsp:Transcript_7763/g.19300  ORF Transcript_7763/g.19300 Transcript_7763/m.19300 type:complete len:96 (-) Transcript_7763:15-302(-)